MKSKFRAAYRLALLAGLFLFAYLDFFLRVWLPGRAGSISARARWMQWWSRNFLALMHCTVTVRGQPPTAGVLVSNHLSYVDVLVYGSIRPFVFLSKSEVRSWPVVGMLTRFAGTLFIQRESRSDVARLGPDMVPAVNSGVVVTLFLEGTSTDGQTVLPFRSALLSTAEQHGWPVSAGWIHYTLAGGSVAEEICYWRDMTFFPHLLNLLSREKFDALVCFDEPLAAKMDRKEMARELHARVCRLKKWEEEKQ